MLNKKLWVFVLAIFILFPLKIHAFLLDATDLVGQIDHLTKDPLWTDTTFNSEGSSFTPKSLAIDTVNHRLFIADGPKNRVLIFNLDVNNNLADLKPDNVLGQISFDYSSPATTQEGLSSPAGLAYDATNQRLFVGDGGNSRIMVFDVTTITDGENAVNVLGQVDFVSSGAATSQNGFDGFDSLAYDATNQRLFVADNGNRRIMVFDVTAITDGENAVNVLGQVDFVSSSSTPPISEKGVFFSQGGLAYDSTNQKLLVPDIGSSRNRVMFFDVTSITDGEDAVDILAWPNTEFFYHVNDSVIDTVNHRLFIADNGNKRVAIFNLDSNNDLIDHEIDYVLGKQHFYVEPVVFGVDEEILEDPKNIALDLTNQRLFVSDPENSRVLVFDLSSGITNGMAASHVLGQPDFNSNINTTTQDGLWGPRGLEYDSTDQRLFIADSPNHRVLVFDLSSGITNGMNASYVLGQPDFLTGAAATTEDGFASPRGLVYDATRKWLFVSEYSNRRVLVFDLSSGITNGMNASYVLGQPDFLTNTGTTTQNGLDVSYGLAFSPSTNLLFVADVGGSRVLVFDTTSISNGMNAINVLGQADFTTNNTTSSRSELFWPYGVDFDDNKNILYVSDEENSRVVFFQLPKITTSSLSATAGEVYSGTVSGTGGTAPYVCSLQSGSLPAGLTLNSDCTITGTGTSASNSTFTVRLSDSSITSPETTGFFDDQLLSFTVNAGAENNSATSSGSRSRFVSNKLLSPQIQIPQNGIKPSTIVLNLARNLKIGMRGEDVKELQKYLTNKGYVLGIIDGIFGPKTKKAVIEFQLANLLKGDGIVGPLTREKLK